MKTYRIVLRDANGFVTHETEAEGIKAAKFMARYLVSSIFAKASEHAHAAGDRAEVSNEQGEIVFDLECEIESEVCQ